MATPKAPEWSEDVRVSYLGMAVNNPVLWETAKQPLAVVWPEEIELIDSAAAETRRTKARETIMKSVIDESARPEDFDERLTAVIDAMAAIAENVEIFKGETKNGVGRSNERFYVRTARFDAFNGEIAFAHRKAI